MASVNDVGAPVDHQPSHERPQRGEVVLDHLGRSAAEPPDQRNPCRGDTRRASGRGHHEQLGRPGDLLVCPAGFLQDGLAGLKPAAHEQPVERDDPGVK